MAPAPKPKGIAQRISKKIFPERAYPKSERAVTTVLTAVTLGVPKRLIILAAKRDETTVQALVIKLKIPCAEIESPKSIYIEGQQAPSKESGMPSPMKSIKITTNNAVAIESSINFLNEVILAFIYCFCKVFRHLQEEKYSV